MSVFYCAWLLRRGYNLAQVRFYKPQHLGLQRTRPRATRLWQKHRRGIAADAA